MTDPQTHMLPDEAGAQAHHWIARLASGEITETEMADFRQWRSLPDNEQIFRRERALWRRLDGVEGAFSARAMPRRRSGRPLRWLPFGKRRMLAGAVAASLIALMAGPQLALMMRADHRTSTGEVRRVALADGSEAVLDSGSAIAVDFKASGRDVTLLAGRAWFNVRHDDARPFRVAALGGVTQDIGTAFEVERGDAGVNVGVTDGSVKLTSSIKGAPLILKAGQHAHYDSGVAVQRTAGLPTNDMAAWRTGELLIRDMEVSAAIRAVARYRKAPVFIWGTMDRLEPVSGTFTTDQPDDALATLAQMRGLEITRLPGGVLFVRGASAA